MTIEEYRQMAKEGAIKKGDYENEDVRTHGLIEKWKTFYLNELRILQDMGRELKTITHERSQFYLGKSPVPYEFVVIKSELSRYLDADPKMQEISKRIDEQAAIVDYVKEMVDSFKRRGFEIQGARSWYIWCNGGKG